MLLFANVQTRECKPCTQVGVDPRLRDLAQQLLLAVTNAEAVEEAVVVLMTDAAADTAAQVVAAAEQLTPMLQQGQAAQVTPPLLLTSFVLFKDIQMLLAEHGAVFSAVSA